MEISTALGILRRLSDGIDPVTGEVFPTGSPYQQPDIIRALFMAVNSLEKTQEKAARRETLPVNAGKPWTKEEEKLLTDSFDKGVTVNELAKAHERRPGAITSRLLKLGKINLPNALPSNLPSI